MFLSQIDGETYFNNFEQSGYEELKDWTPGYYQLIKEADANLQFAGKTIDQMAQALEDWCSNMFIDTMSEETLSRMEEFFYLDNSDRTLDERKKLLKAAQLGSGKMDVDRIKRIVKVYAGVDCHVEFPRELIIAFDIDSAVNDFTGVKDILGKQLPAHLYWSIRQEIELDNSNLEQIILKNIHFKMSIPFWTEFIFDGTWILDGSVVFKARRYGLKLGTIINQGIFHIKEMIKPHFAKYAAQVVNNGMINAKANQSFGIIFLNNYSPKMSLMLHIKTDFSENEDVGNASVETKSPDCWFLNGDLLFDGTRKLNSIYRKETL